MIEFEKLFNHLKECVDNDDNTGITEDGIEFNLFEWSFGLAVKAKKEHDLLEAENAKLIEALKESNEVFRRNLSKYFYKDEVSMLSALEKNKQLLTEIGVKQ